MKFIFAVTLLFAPSAFACGPWGCYSNTCLTYGPNSTVIPDLDTCGQMQLSHLDPNNITETNFDILAWELSGAKAPTQTSFASADENSLETLPPENQRTPYTKGIQEFRNGDYLKAIEFFKQVQNSDRDLPRAKYLLARSYLRASQTNYDGYHADQVDKELARKAREAFLAFAKQYPEHEWAKSAWGLARRSGFISDNIDAYSADWGAAVDTALARSPRDEGEITGLFNEAMHLDPKVMAASKHLHPILWVIRAYYVTRKFNEQNSFDWDLKVQEQALQVDEPSFAKYKDLYAWSRAVLLLGLGRAQEGYDLLQKQPVAKTNGGSLSWIVLNARLLMALNRYDDARAIVEKFIKAHPMKAEVRALEKSNVIRSKPQLATYQIGPNFGPDENSNRNVAIDSRNFYSMTYIWQKTPAAIATRKNLDLMTTAPLVRVFVQGTTPEQMIATLAKADLDPKLREQLEPVVMAKLIVRSKWNDAVEAYKHVSTAAAKKEFKLLASSAERLASDEKDAEANARVGLFVSSIEPSPKIFAACESQSFGDITSAMDYYLLALEGFKANDAKKNPLEAELLRGMLLCFKDHYGAPYCGPKAVKWDEKTSLPVSARKAWWTRLQKRFKGSREAKQTPIYW